VFRPSAPLNEMKITVHPWYDAERNVVILRWGVYREGLIADCVREVSPGETAFGRTFEELLIGRSFEADSPRSQCRPTRCGRKH
jgi:hypothetical protein